MGFVAERMACVPSLYSVIETLELAVHRARTLGRRMASRCCNRESRLHGHSALP